MTKRLAAIPPRPRWKLSELFMAKLDKTTEAMMADVADDGLTLQRMQEILVEKL